MMRRTYSKPLLLICLIILIGVAVFTLDINLRQYTPKNIQEYILSYGALAPAVFILLYAIRPLVLFPATVFSLTAGLAFGPLWGTVYTVIGASLSAFLAFGLTRYFGRDIVKKLARGRFGAFEEGAEHHGFQIILFARLLPLFPFDAISFGAGLSKIRFPDFALATVIGIIPGTFVYVYLGNSLIDRSKLTIALVLLAILFLVPLAYRYIRKKKGIEKKK